MSYLLDDPGLIEISDASGPPKVRFAGRASDGFSAPSLARPANKRAHAEGEGVEPSRLIARPFSRRLPSPIGLPFRSNFCDCPDYS